MTFLRLLLLLALAGLGAVSIGGAVLEARWAGETQAAVAQAAANRAATRRIEEAVARARVRLALERARLSSYETARVHLVVSRTDARLGVERGSVLLRTAGLVTALPVGIDTVRSVGASGLELAGGDRLDAAAGLSTPDLAVLRRLVRSGTVVYVF
ncbi:MAG: hypothetical protein ACO3F5_00620 [Gemmatimonadaceae bacterium]